MQHPLDTQLFPYMEFARTESFRSRYCLSQSGMPPPDGPVLGATMPVDLDFAGVRALPELTERVAAHLGLGPERVLVTVGASSAMHLCAQRLFRGARVAAEVPSYEPLRVLPELLGGELAACERRAQDGWQLDPERVAAALAGVPAGRRGPAGHVFLTTPHNPTGARTSRADLARLGRIAAERGGLLVACEVYEEFRGAREYAFEVAPNAISIGSLTKAYGLGALRLGWLAFGAEAAALRPLFEDASFLCYVDPPTPALRAGITAFDALAALRAPIARVERESKPHVARFLAETDGVDGPLPESGIIAFPRLAGIDDTRAFGRFLAGEFDVDVVPGEFFGAPGHVRIGFGQPEETVRDGLARLADALAAWRART